MVAISYVEVEIWSFLIFNVRRRIRMITYYKVWQFNFASFFDIFYITNYGKVILLQCVTDCYYKVRQVLQCMTDCYYKVRQVLQCVTDCYYKVRQVLQSVTDFITKFDRYYKVWQLLDVAASLICLNSFEEMYSITLGKGCQL